MFRTQQNVPEYYVNNSRDFQLLCRLKDAIFGSVKYSIDSLTHTANTKETNSRLLALLKTKLGFFSDIELTDEELRILLEAFPTIMRNKGTKLGIEQLMHTFFRMKKIKQSVAYVVLSQTDHTVNLYLGISKQDLSLLDVLFEYIIPTGFEINYEFSEEISPYTNKYRINEFTNIEDYVDSEIGKVRNSNDPGKTLHMVGLTNVNKGGGN